MLEVGPGKILGSLAKLQDPRISQRVVSSLRHYDDHVDDLEFFQSRVADLWLAGAEVRWTVDDQPLGRRIALPTYAFQRRQHLIEPPLRRSMADTQPEELPPIGVAQTATVTAHTPSFNSPHEHPQGMTEGPGEPAVKTTRKDLILEKLSLIIQEMSGLEADDIDVVRSFLDMGFDSLFLTQANLRFKKEFKVRITFRQLFDEAPCLNQLATYIDRQLPDGALAAQLGARRAEPPTNLAPAGTESRPDSAEESDPASAAGLSLQGSDVPQTAAGHDGLQRALALQAEASAALLHFIQAGLPVQASPASATVETSRTELDASRFSKQPPAHGRIGPYRPLKRSISGELSSRQKTYLKQFIADYTRRTQKSKALTAEHRRHFADPRVVGGFKTIWKEICYPIAAERSKGARLWDVDGNEYVDCVGGFGAGYFGQGPDFVLDAVRKQLDVSVDYGPQSPLAGSLAKKICHLTGFERAAFCNTGSEAVLAAIRMARTATGNDLIATFSGDYHGLFDEVLVKPQVVGKKRRNMAVAPDIPSNAHENILVLEYGDPSSLDIIRERADELAGILVEPVQSRNPELQPRAFLQELREITRDAGLPLIFDEIITGFRLHNKGAQAWFDVDADIAAYGKVIGGGLPIGVVAGKSEYMDALDGGMWQYGDDSFPEAGVTYFAGTFVRHPLALAAVNAVLTRLAAEGPTLQRRTNRDAAVLCERIARRFHQLGIPIEMAYFGTVILPRYRGNPDFEGLFFYHLRHLGVHIWEGRPGFLTTEHRTVEMEFLEEGFVKAGLAMKANGFFPERETSSREEVKFSSFQKDLWQLLATGSEVELSTCDQIVIEIDSHVDVQVLGLALDKAVNRHPLLRAVVRDDESGLAIEHYVEPSLEFVDLTEAGGTDETSLASTIDFQRRAGFEYKKGPLVRGLGNLQQWLIGTYHGVSRPQLPVYLDEFVFRHNRRRQPMAAFQTLLGLGTAHRPTPARRIRGARDLQP